MPLVVIRQLPGRKPVTHCIVMESKDPDVDDQQNYMEDIANRSIIKLKEQFPEFREAAFYKDTIPEGGIL